MRSLLALADTDGVLNSVCIPVSAAKAAGGTPGMAGDKEKTRLLETGPIQAPGNVLLSHTVSRAVPSALEGLATLFGRGRGVSLPLKPPEAKESIADRND